MPTPNTSEVKVSRDSKKKQITLSIELYDISGDLCELNDLWVQYDLHGQTAQSQSYKVGNNMQVFNGLILENIYNYQIRITVNDEDVIASFRGTATIRKYNKK